MIGYIEHHIVDHCNLRCAGCSHFSPLADPWFEDIVDFNYDFSALAKLTNHYIPVIRIMGGEPLLHPSVELFLETVRAMFTESEIQLVTNGLLLGKKGQEFADFCNAFKITICVSDYGLNLNLPELLKPFYYKRVDGKGQLYNISLDLTGSQDLQQAFNRCDLHINRWYFFQFGRMYPCCICPNLHIFNNFFRYELKYPKLKEEKWTEDELSISVYNHTLEEVESFLNTPIPLCKYCNTAIRCHTYSPFKISKGEITEWTCQ